MHQHEIVSSVDFATFSQRLMFHACDGSHLYVGEWSGRKTMRITRNRFGFVELSPRSQLDAVKNLVRIIHNTLSKYLHI